jgi:hypothetical protein
MAREDDSYTKRERERERGESVTYKRERLLFEAVAQGSKRAQECVREV